MNYFQGITSIEEAKQRYKELAREHHPDKGGDVETMKSINNQYDKIAQGIFEKGGKSITEIEELLAKDAALREKLDAIIGLDGIEIEICGCWLWVTGNTIVCKGQLKGAGFYWANQKKAWYWRAEAKRSYNRHDWSLDRIRVEYGSHKLNTVQRMAIA